MSSADTQVLNGVAMDVHKTDEVKTASLVNGPQSASFFQLAITALRLTATATIPSNDRNNNNLRLRKQFTLDEVAYHDTMNDCWIVLYDRVYDITNFLELVSEIRVHLVIYFKVDKLCISWKKFVNYRARPTIVVC